MKQLFKIVWTFRTSLKAAKTIDENGFILMEFCFNSGERKEVLAVQLNQGDVSFWQRVPMTTKGYLTDVRVWQDKNECLYIHAQPSQDIRSQLKD